MHLTEEGTLCKDKVAAKHFDLKCNGGMTTVISYDIETGFQDSHE